MTGIRVNEYGPGDVQRQEMVFWKWLAPHIVRAVESSFLEAGMTSPTLAEMRQRTNLAKDICNTLKYDLKWSKQRIADRLPALLRAKLLKMKDPIDQENARQTFSPDSAAASATAPPIKVSSATAEELDKEFGKVKKDVLRTDDPLDLAGPAEDEMKIIETADEDETV